MKITISSGASDDARDVTVEDENGKLASFKADNLHEAHKMLTHGRKEGWDSLKAPEKPAQPKKAK